MPLPTLYNQHTKHTQSVLDFRGGETAALARLKHYLWDTDAVSKYFDTRNGMLGGDYSTKFSPWLAAGCLSPRLVYGELKRYEAERVANKSTYWVRACVRACVRGFELAYRECCAWRWPCSVASSVCSVLWCRRARWGTHVSRAALWRDSVHVRRTFSCDSGHRIFKSACHTTHTHTHTPRSCLSCSGATTFGFTH